MTISELSSADAPTAVESLTAAFQPDPGFVFISPDEELRVPVARAVFEVMVRYGLQHGTVLGSDDATGVAICIPPGHVVTPEGMGAAGMGDAAAVLGDDAMERMVRLVGTLGQLHGAVMDEPHWQLMFLGVQPGAQGAGHGVALVDALVERSGVDGVPTYLDTLTSRNVGFYTRRGYYEIGEVDIPESDVHAWGMRT